MSEDDKRDNAIVRPDDAADAIVYATLREVAVLQEAAAAFDDWLRRLPQSSLWRRPFEVSRDEIVWTLDHLPSTLIVTLTRAEAVAVAEHAIEYTVSDSRSADYSTRDGCEAVIRRLQAEVAIIDGGGWWDATPATCGLDEAGSPVFVMLGDEFPMSAAGVAAIVELLPEMLADAAQLAEGGDGERYEAHREVLLGLADRLGVEVETGATA